MIEEVHPAPDSEPDPERYPVLNSNVPSHPILVVMGVSGTGKSTIAGLLAGKLGWNLLEGDDLHPPTNIKKMESGRPLSDADRWPWLDLIAEQIVNASAEGRPNIVTCSALKRAYRDRIRTDKVIFIYLRGSLQVLERRLGARLDHFMPPALLQSQIDTLEPLGDDEPHVTVDIGLPPAVIAELIIDTLQLK